MTTLHHQVPVTAAPAKVYAAVATQEGMRGWWTADTIMDAVIGGKAQFGFDRREMVFRMIIEALDPDKRVVLRCLGDHPEWEGTVLTFNVEASENGAIMRFNHSHWRDSTDFCASCNSTWGELMYRLKGYVEGARPGPRWAE